MPESEEEVRFYVDQPKTAPQGREVDGYRAAQWSHLATNGSEADLIAFGDSIGLRRTWLQKSGTVYVHYDVTRSKRREAIVAGAYEVTSQELVKLCVWPKRPPRQS